MTSLKTSIKTITYLSDTGCLEIQGASLLQANVTANDAQDVALLKHLNVLGLPTILFFDGQGQEHPQARVTGFMDAETFSAHLRDRQP